MHAEGDLAKALRWSTSRQDLDVSSIWRLNQLQSYPAVERIVRHKHGAHLITRQDTCFVCRPAPDWCQYHEPTTSRLLSNKQAYSLDFAITAHTEVCILPVDVKSDVYVL